MTKNPQNIYIEKITLWKKMPTKHKEEEASICIRKEELTEKDEAKSEGKEIRRGHEYIEEVRRPG